VRVLEVAVAAEVVDHGHPLGRGRGRGLVVVVAVALARRLDPHLGAAGAGAGAGAGAAPPRRPPLRPCPCWRSHSRRERRGAPPRIRRPHSAGLPAWTLGTGGWYGWDGRNKKANAGKGTSQ
jgi:hypothetical protein